MKPTVGRIVHVFNLGLDSTVPCAAIVTDVWRDLDMSVNVCVFLPHGGTVGYSHVPQYNADVPRGDKPYWKWPPRE